MSDIDNYDSKDMLTKKSISIPPLNLLFNPTIIDKQDVWKIDVVKLLEMLLDLISKTGNKDLRICGVAILTSTLIHRLKVESIFKLDKIANQKSSSNGTNINDEQKIPIPEITNISLPFRQEMTYPVSLEDLLLILENMIIELSNPISKKNVLRIEPVETVDFQEYLIKFEKIIEEYEIKLFDTISKKREIIFNEFVFNMNSLDISRYFIAMLYLAMKEKIEIVTIDKPVLSNNAFSDNHFNNMNSNNNTESIKIIVKNN